MVVLGGRYELVRPIARGGMAEVWESHDAIAGRAVAVKVLHSALAGDPVARSRFALEAEAVSQLRHPGIVAVFDTFGDDVLAIVMELVRGTTLRAHIDSAGPLEPWEVAELGAEVADALAAAHHAGVVHRDVKPANILLSEDGRVLVADFGIARVRGSADLTSTGMVIGTAKYLSPEQVRGERADERSDVYALGAVLYEAVTGKAPFGGDTWVSTALARLDGEPEPVRDLRPEVPPDLAEAISKALSGSPEDRFTTAAAMADALRRVDLDPPDTPTVALYDQQADDDPTTVLDGTVLMATRPQPPPPPPAPDPVEEAPTSAGPRPDVPHGGFSPWLVLVIVAASVAFAALLVIQGTGWMP